MSASSSSSARAKALWDASSHHDADAHARLFALDDFDSAGADVVGGAPAPAPSSASAAGAGAGASSQTASASGLAQPSTSTLLHTSLGSSLSLSLRHRQLLEDRVYQLRRQQQLQQKEERAIVGRRKARRQENGQCRLFTRLESRMIGSAWRKGDADARPRFFSSPSD